MTRYTSRFEPYSRCRNSRFLVLLSGATVRRRGNCSRVSIAASSPLNQRAATTDSAAEIRSYMSTRSFRARTVSSTRYAMAPAHFVEEFAGWTHPAVGDVVVALPQSFVDIGAGCDIEQ